MESVCHYSAVRYVPDPSRNEPRNIGVLVVCPAAGYARGKFSLSRTYLEPTSIKFRFLRAAIQGFGHELPATAGSDFEVSATDRLDVAQLRGYYEEAGNILQLTDPLPSIGDP